ncbi:MAG: hypothetical protein NC489_18965 [Ruminococcus flavefaciens]|nr:hypothetical protein [Ruminococcus flavefaciens]
MFSAIDRYNDFGSPARDEYAELMALQMMEAAERAEQAVVARRPATAVSQKTAYAYEVYARSWGKSGKYTGGYV